MKASNKLFAGKSNHQSTWARVKLKCCFFRQGLPIKAAGWCWGRLASESFRRPDGISPGKGGGRLLLMKRVGRIAVGGDASPLPDYKNTIGENSMMCQSCHYKAHGGCAHFFSKRIRTQINDTSLGVNPSITYFPLLNSMDAPNQASETKTQLSKWHS